MALWLGPVVGIISMFSCRVGELQRYCSPLVFEQIAMDARIEYILIRPYTSGYFHYFAIGLKARFYLTIPKFLFLTNSGECFQRNGSALDIFK